PRGGPSDPAELRYGLYRADGRAKPAAATVRAAFTGSVPASFNNGFERGAGRRGPPAAWRQHGARNFRVAWDTRVRRSGRASARLASAGGHATGPGAISVLVPEPPTPGARYVVTAWGRGAGAIGRSRLVLAWYDASGRELVRATSAPLLAGGSWGRLVARGTAPADAAYARVRLESERSRGTVWFDDVALGRRR
ncbi:MAG: hypothetical protein ICV64_07585, partial [Thermoleophilia bacterium]|nr:hypothetical protein [Thermoleophilia bacterium]